MGRKSGIWLRKQNKTWYVNHRGRQVNLGKDKAAAEKQFYRLMAEEEERETKSLTAAELFDKFLLWCRDNRAIRTFEWYRDHLQTLLDHLPDQNVAAKDLKPYHVYEACKASWSASYKRGFMISCQRAYKWGIKHGYIDRSPLELLEKPTPTRRDNCPSAEDYQAMLTHSRGAFRELLEFSWETGARPQELFQLKVAHVKADRIQFSVAESKGKRSKRVIYLTEKAAKIAASLIKDRSKEEFVFLNKLGNPWNKSSVGCQMGRLKKKTGKRFGLYDIRHAFATRMLESGLGHITVGKLMGHKDASMISRVYSHIGEQNDFLLQELRKVS